MEKYNITDVYVIVGDLHSYGSSMGMQVIFHFRQSQPFITAAILARSASVHSGLIPTYAVRDR